MNTEKKPFLSSNTKLLFEFDYTNCSEVISNWLSMKSIISICYRLFLYFMFAVFLINSILLGRLDPVIINIGIGIVYFVISIGVHQFIHLFSARLVGYKNTKFIVPKASVFCYCDQKILNAKQYIFISMSPFIIITLISLVLMFLFPEYISAISLFNIFYTIFCNGDIAITNYLSKNPEVYFYCEQKKNTAYLFKKL